MAAIPRTRILKALERASDVARNKGCIIEVCAGNVTYRVLPEAHTANPDNTKPVDIPDGTRL